MEMKINEWRGLMRRVDEFILVNRSKVLNLSDKGSQTKTSQVTEVGQTLSCRRIFKLII